MEQKKKKFAVPHVYILLLALILLCSILTYIIPAGSYDMMTLEDGREVVNAETFHNVDSTPVSFLQFLTAVPRGMQESAQIIFFIFIVGGTMAVVQETRAIEAGMGRLIKALKDKSIIIIPIIMVLFSICGSVFGMAEETIPFIPIFVSLCIAMGFDSITGAAIVLCGAGAGFAGAFMNPFTIQVAQGIAGLPPLSAMGFRVVLYICFVLLAVTFVMRYALKIKKNPQLSNMHEFDKTREESVDLDSLPEFGGKEKAILIVFVASIIILVYCVIQYGWYMDEIAALFLCMSFIVATIAGMGFNNYANVLGKGMADIASGALVVGFARGILVVMNDGQILHTILQAAASGLSKLPSMVSAVGMYIFQCLLNFIVPSGSGQAAVSMPIMAPLGDLVGVTRQTACLAFQMGDGISNIFTPTSGYFMAGLAIAKVPWSKWAKWILPLIGLEYLLGAIFIVIAQAMQLGPF
ncbi:YfcC family protein [Emergencia sp. 1XD21-10]|uniref:YfcC family protein n=1 Tax=Emergencia sp. 1XD21-10 TaxID=2304569 RepID=UPI0013794F8F|nr:AbgT family transporter [Emergencia sp. 1XD21-10]NCF00295.1 putative basic amino acid antiporter YfcC [Emergencia sp. 1XD21-10]